MPGKLILSQINGISDFELAFPTFYFHAAIPNDRLHQVLPVDGITGRMATENRYFHSPLI
jgi:hypothetical protein